MDYYWYFLSMMNFGGPMGETLVAVFRWTIGTYMLEHPFRTEIAVFPVSLSTTEIVGIFSMKTGYDIFFLVQVIPWLLKKHLAKIIREILERRSVWVASLLFFGILEVCEKDRGCQLPNVSFWLVGKMGKVGLIQTETYTWWRFFRPATRIQRMFKNWNGDNTLSTGAWVDRLRPYLPVHDFFKKDISHACTFQIAGINILRPTSVSWTLSSWTLPKMHCSGWTRKLSLWEGDDRDHEASHVGFEHSKDETGGAKIAQTGSGAVGCWQFSENVSPSSLLPKKIHPEMAGAPWP